jgi:UDP-glucose 4-epimerase
VIPNFITAMLAGEQPVVYGDGEQSRDFTHVENVVDATLLAMDREGVAGQIFNIAAGERVSLNRVLEYLSELTGTEANARYEPARPGEVRHSQADISAAKEALGYRPAITAEEGLRRTVEWFQDQVAFTRPAGA